MVSVFRWGARPRRPAADGSATALAALVLPEGQMLRIHAEVFQHAR